MRSISFKALAVACICAVSVCGFAPASAPAYAYTQMIAAIQDASVFKDTLAVGETAQIELTWGNGAIPEVVYASSDESIAAVDQDGLVTAIADGTATITVSRADGTSPKSLEITVSHEAEKSIVYNTSELTLGQKLRKYDTLHYDNQNQGSCANIVNTKGSYDLAFISEKDYVLPFDAEYVGGFGLYIYLAPDLEGITYLDGRKLQAGDVIDRNTHLLCYDYEIKSADRSTKLMFPVFLPKYYEKYIGDGEIRLHSIDHESKVIELEAVPVSVTEPISEAEPASETEPTSETEPASETEPTSETEPASETEPTNETEPVIQDDVNADGELSLLDVILLQKWLLCEGNAALTICAENADYNGDGIVDVFDLALMKRALLS